MRKLCFLSIGVLTGLAFKGLRASSFLYRVAVIIIFFLLITLFSTAQNLQNANWCFLDYSRVNFTTNPPTATDCPISPRLNYNGTDAASVSDDQGQLLFYTNGNSVWGRDNAIMPNGTQLYASGCCWAQQGVVIVPKPNHPNLYYIFTGSAEYGVSPNYGRVGVYYSLVDMCLNNGNGDIVPSLKNIPLKDPGGVLIDHDFNSGIGLKVEAVKMTTSINSSGEKIWVVFFLQFFENGIAKRYSYNYLISQTGVNDFADGVSPTPTNFFSIDNSNYPGAPNAGDFFGSIKISPDGSKLAHASPYGVNLYNFSNNSGNISFNNNIYSGTQGVDNAGYGIEFSPNSQFVYFSVFSNEIIQNKQDPEGAGEDSQPTIYLYQRQLSADVNVEIAKFPIEVSNKLSSSIPVPRPYGLQRGIDDKVYVCVSVYEPGQPVWGWLGAIKQPNIAHPGCDFNQKEISLYPGTNHQGMLPQWVYKVAGGLPSPCTPPSGQWVWMHGDNIPLQDGNYGVQGVPTSANKPSYRQAASTWTDASGNLWLFGGWKQGPNSTILGYFNDLWKYNINTNQWTWINGDNILDQSGVYGIQGVSSSSNKPGSRAFATTWVDQFNNLWLFGGQWNSATPNSRLLFSDLWKYDISSNQWTWMKGDNSANQAGVYGTQTIPSASNKPGGRYDMLSWADQSGNLWLHGGLGYDNVGPPPPPLTTIKYLADLWKYNIGTNQWTWMKGPNYYDVSLPPAGLNSFGTQGIETSGNLPTNHQGSGGWVSGNYLYFFGGMAPYNSNYNVATVDNVWRFNIITNNWTWMKGNGSVPDPQAVYGTQGVPSGNNTPGGRYQFCAWKDDLGYFWTYGHYGNDLWKFDAGSLMWTWIEGSGTPFNPPPVYGTQGIGSPSTNPGRRTGSAYWTGNNNVLWLFGGVGNISVNNDLWKYTGNCTGPNCRGAATLPEKKQVHNNFRSLKPDTRLLDKEPQLSDIRCIEIFNMSGQLIKRTTLSSDYIGLLRLNKLPGISRGIYVVKVLDKYNFQYTVKKLFN